MTYDPAAPNPLAGNPFATRDDVARAVRDLFEPLLPFFSEGGARVRLSATAAHFDRAAADLEGFARPLWGLAALAAGNGSFAHWGLYRRGLVNGTDPAHPEYWGDISDRDQRQVELAAVGFALLFAPGEIWEPLGPEERERLTAYLLKARERDYVDNNWKFFRVLVDLALVRCGVTIDRSKTEAYLDEVEGFAMDDGWYRDGPVRRTDHYVPFAMHYYGLVYAALSGDEERAARYRARARRFTADIRHWYGPDGASLPFGRSQTYRFAAAGFWGALALAGEEALPWGEIKGYYLRNLRWWARLPITDRDGVLSIGYGYPNLLMSESYNSAGSPYWAMKVFLPLALPADHPFWTAEEILPPAFPDPVPLPQPGMVAMHTPANVVLLSSGQQHGKMRGAAEKYAKFVYSTRYAFSVEADERNYEAAAFDGMIGFSDDGVHFRARETLEDARIEGDMLWSRWRPYPDVEVETWLLPAAPWHLRIHRITTPRPLHATEGGFAIERADFNTDRLVSMPGRAECHGREDVSIILDLSATPREGKAISPIANSHLIWSKTVLPQLRGAVPVGVTTLITAAVALPVGSADIPAPPAAPSLEHLQQRLANARLVPVFQLQDG